MYDPVTLDQLRAFVCVVEEGSFSAAARKLQRVQSAISTSMSNLESQLEISIWDRASRAAKLTDQGQALVSAARRVLTEVDGLRRLTAGMVMGLEPSVSLCLDAFFPLPVLVKLCAGFASEFPAVDLRVETQVMSAVAARVLAGAATLGVVSPMGLAPGLERRALALIRMVPVVSPDHSLAKAKGPISTKRLADSIQIVLSERNDVGVADQGVLSTRTWRVGDLHTKHALLRAGLGWGNLPHHLVRDEVRQRKLVIIRPEAWAEDEHSLHLSAIYRSDTTFGPAHRWLLAHLEDLCLRETGQPKKRGQARRPAGATPPRKAAVLRAPRNDSSKK
jgi:DNA-binding transcriptional LysR family regulator